jgi:uncharacterized protein (TIGR02284 family)
MSTDNQALAQTLNELLNTTANAREAYKNASKNVHNKPLTLFFEDAAHEHEQFSDALKAEIQKLGEKPHEKTSFKSDTNRFWLDFASIITGRNEAAILQACHDAEDETIKQYDSTLQLDGLSEEMRKRLNQQKSYAVRQKEEVDKLLDKYPSD